MPTPKKSKKKDPKKKIKPTGLTTKEETKEGGFKTTTHYDIPGPPPILTQEQFDGLKEDYLLIQNHRKLTMRQILAGFHRILDEIEGRGRVQRPRTPTNKGRRA